eukprot:2560073-Alexandrium_andersonii.AAC.1
MCPVYPTSVFKGVNPQPTRAQDGAQHEAVLPGFRAVVGQAKPGAGLQSQGRQAPTAHQHGGGDMRGP